jgi:hypothetical protein
MAPVVKSLRWTDWADSVVRMRKYLFGTGLVTAIIGGVTLLRGLRSDETFTWRTALAWISWGISLTLAIGSVIDTRRAARGKLIPTDSPAYKEDNKEMFRKRLRR